MASSSDTKAGGGSGSSSDESSVPEPVLDQTAEGLLTFLQTFLQAYRTQRRQNVSNELATPLNLANKDF